MVAAGALRLLPGVHRHGRREALLHRGARQGRRTCRHVAGRAGLVAGGRGGLGPRRPGGGGSGGGRLRGRTGRRSTDTGRRPCCTGAVRTSRLRQPATDADNPRAVTIVSRPMTANYNTSGGTDTVNTPA